MSNDKLQAGRLAIWAGIECTINRVGNQYFDQLGYSGHYQRPEDIGHLAKLGIEMLRYPVLWERHKQDKDAVIDWTFAEKNLNAIEAAGITPIVGLVHHGSGPEWVNFFDGSFEKGLEEYALEVAKKFPRIEYFTPVNEPLTTARFCGLYGLWYPHGRSDETFARVLLAECKATVMAMKAIRSINPKAKLIQTDDLGKIYSTPALKYQAGFENERRWLAFDLISGKVQPGHPMWAYLLWAGIDESDLYFMLEHAVVPHIIGLNYYLTSERYIDESLEHYPPHTHGGNGIHQYADVEAIRVGMGDDEECGAAHLLREAWDRYRLPMAVTEAHLHCSREQQGRWLRHIWQTATYLKEKEGIDLRAVTAWAAFGSYGWNRLLTEPGGEYEPGIFDVRGGQPRATALAGVISALAKGDGKIHPAFDGPGWWSLPERLHYQKGEAQHEAAGRSASYTQPLLILGATGTLGKAFSRICTERGIHHIVLARPQMDITAPVGDLARELAEIKPWAVINATGYVRVDDAEDDRHACYSINTNGAASLAAACKMTGVKLLTFSSDLVFNGTKGTPYSEQDATQPLNIYGHSKALAEADILSQCPEAFIVRTSAFFSPWDAHNFLTIALRELSAGRPFTAADDVYISPTYVPDLVQYSLDLLIDDARGIWHLANEGNISWAALAKMAGSLAGLDTGRIIPLPQCSMGWKAARPKNSSLTSARGILLPTLENALERYMAATKPGAFQRDGMVMSGVE